MNNVYPIHPNTAQKIPPSNSNEHSYQLLKDVIPLLLKYQQPAKPINYALWYAYLEQNDSELVTQMQTLLAKQKGKLSDMQVQEFHERFFKPENQQAKEFIQQTMLTVLAEANLKANAQKQTTQQFTRLLTRTQDKLKAAKSDPDKLVDYVDSLLVGSGKMVNSTQKYCEALTAAQQQIIDLQAKVAELESHALKDSLTGLYNRRYFNSDIQTYEQNNDYCLMMVDVDNFKQFNDTYGHVMGDKALARVGQVLAKQVGVRCYRYGGEEFAILCPDTSAEKAHKLAEHIRDLVSKIRMKRSDATISGVLTVSIGIKYVGHRPEPTESVIMLADKKLYEAKREGRNRVVI
ncbi:MAG: diguanylate cyclase [Alteromonadaceae bacterium]|nr:diguanylate cyclase [Alteromonadaceae bacterium]